METIIINTHHHDHDVVLFERAVEPEERDDEDDDSSRDTKRREREEPLRQELMVPIVGSLNRTAHRQYNDTSYLKTPTHEHMTSHKLHYAHYTQLRLHNLPETESLLSLMCISQL